MGHIPLSDNKLRVGKANLDGMKESSATRNKSIVEISPNFANNAPLWFYILAEAQQFAFSNAHPFTNDTPIHLGPVGGRIVGEVFVGLLYGDSTSVINHPIWKPYEDFLNKDNEFGIVELILQAQKA